jgi:hypothetical protein
VRKPKMTPQTPTTSVGMGDVQHDVARLPRPVTQRHRGTPALLTVVATMPSTMTTSMSGYLCNMSIGKHSNVSIAGHRCGA